MTGARFAGLAAGLGLALAAGPAGAAEVSVESGAFLDLGSSQLDLGCGDLIVAGTFEGGSGILQQARDVTISSGGTLQGEAGILRVAGDWSNAGTFSAGTSSVELVDGCSRTTANVSGSSSFFELEMITSTGKSLVFDAGSTTAVTSGLTLAGASGNLLSVRSSAGGSEAFLDVQGSQSISFVDVEDNHAVGDPLIVGSESVLGANTDGWSFASAVPVLGPLGLGVLIVFLVLSGMRTARASRGPL